MAYEDTHFDATGHVNTPKGLKPVVAGAASDTPENPGVAPKTAPLAPGKPDKEQPYRQPAEPKKEEPKETPKPAPPKKSGKDA